jgi:putative N-acetylmannosamine-6-phosphate epimerase
VANYFTGYTEEVGNTQEQNTIYQYDKQDCLLKVFENGQTQSPRQFIHAMIMGTGCLLLTAMAIQSFIKSKLLYGERSK